MLRISLTILFIFEVQYWIRDTSYAIVLTRSLSSFVIANSVSLSFYFYLVCTCMFVVCVQGCSSIYSHRDFAVTPQI